MGHVKQKKSTSNNNSTPPETLSIAEVVNNKERPSTSEHRLSQPSLSNLRDSSYPEQLNAEELISQINCRNTQNEVSNDTNNNCNNNNNTRPSNNNSNNHPPPPPPPTSRPLQQHQVHFQQQNSSSRQPPQQLQLHNIVENNQNNVDEEDVENGTEKKHIRQRPLHRRLISYIRNLWIGARLNAGKDGKLYCYSVKIQDIEIDREKRKNVNGKSKILNNRIQLNIHSNRFSFSC